MSRAPVTSPSRQPAPSPWLEELSAEDAVPTAPAPPEECDVCIVGAGMTGCALAYHLKTLRSGSGTPLKVVVLDAREVSGGASGRNGGILWPCADEPFEVTPRSSIDLYS